MGLFGRSKQTNEELEKLQLALVALRVEVDRERSDSASTRQRLQDLESRATPAPADSDWGTPDPELSLGDVRRLATETTATAEAHSRELLDVHARLTAVDARLAELTDTITNQLAEIGQDIDRLEASSTQGRATPAGDTEIDRTAIDDGRFDELRTNQARIANEQARFAKALHEQLAALADELRRSAR